MLASGLAAGGPRTDGPPTDGVREDRLPAGPEPVPLNFLLEKGPFVFTSQGPDADAVMIQRFAESSGLRAKKLAGNVRGSTWVLERGRPLPANE